MVSLSDIPKESYDYWEERLRRSAEDINEIDISDISDISDSNDKEISGLMKSSIAKECLLIADSISNISQSKLQSGEINSREILNPLTLIATLIIKIDDYATLSYNSNRYAGLSGAISKLFKLLKNIQSWLFNILQAATVLKGWKIKGSLGNQILGLAQAEIEISFGQ
ncbi:hypothetical protein [Notoacmeibacter marinus]|uniref:hypothetical protein n=1 Tax=Notoacmeibacter marinus TaxID=1876515 RepID=UPI00117BAEC1|nr:hypothetical protein [Notoacmeibacter marinus]